MSESQAKLPSAPLFPGPGELSYLMGSHHWELTALGPPGNWALSLKTVVRVILTSRYAMWMGWGENLTFFYNDAYRPTLGLKHPMALGKPASEVWAEIWPEIGPRISRVMSTGTATYDEGLLLFLERSGFREETYHTFSYSPLTDDSGEIGGMLCVVTEETERCINERRLKLLRVLATALSASKTMANVFQAIAASLPTNGKDLPFTLTYIIDNDDALELVASSGIDRDHPMAAPRIGKRERSPFFGLVGNLEWVTESVDVDLRDWADVPKGPWENAPVAAICLPIRKQGTAGIHGYLILGLNPFRRFDEAYAGFISLLADQISAGIASARAFEEEIRRAEALLEIDRAKTAFFSNVSHEFRTPLTLILGSLEELLARPGDPLPQWASTEMQTAHRNSLRLLRLVNSLLDFSRLEAGRAVAHFQETDVGELTAQLASNFCSLVERAGLTFDVSCTRGIVNCYVDRDMWAKVVLNLISNAFKFTFSGGIRVAIQALGEGVELTIADTGTGIPENEIPELFDRFHRVEKARGRTFEGSGIGLALVRELIRLHGGSIGVQSVENHGSTFTARIPFGHLHLPPSHVHPSVSLLPDSSQAEAYVEEADRWTAPSAPLQAVDDSGQKRHKVLLVDDNADMRDYICRLLSGKYDVMTAPDGEEGFSLAFADPPDLIVSDIMMPRVDGFAFVKRLRANLSTKRIPIILLSARAGEEARSEGMDTGADDYLVKPFSARELTARVGAHLALAIARRDAEERASTILESITDGFITLDGDWRLAYINRAAERMEVVSSQLLGQNFWESFPDTLGTQLESEFRRCVAESATVEFEHFYAPWNRWFAVKVYPTKPAGLAVYFREITHTKKLQAKESILARIDHETRAIANPADIAQTVARMLAAHLGIDKCAYVDAEGDGRFPVVGEYGAAMLSGMEFVVEDSELDSRVAGVRNAYRETGVRSVVCLPLMKDGKFSGGLALQHAAPRVWRAEEIELARQVAGRAWESMERSRIALALEENERRLSLAQSAGKMGSFDWQIPEDTVIWSPALEELWGLPGGSFERNFAAWTKRVAFEDGEKIFKEIQSRMARMDSGYEFEFRARMPDETYRWFRGRAKFFYDAHGRPLRMIGMNADIDAQVRQTERLRQAVADLEQFAYSASHDLQEPLRNVSIYSELLAYRYAQRLEGEGLQFLELIRQGSTRMAMLVRDLLSYTKLGHGVETLSGDTDAQDVFENVTLGMAELIRQLGAAVTAEPLPRVAMHAGHFEQLLTNLISNALKYRSDRGPDIRVGAVRQGDKWLFSVEDNGIGIASEYRDLVFGLFKRLHSSDEYEGTGIGLAICQRVVERYGERIWFEAELGKGTTFYFTVKGA